MPINEWLNDGWMFQITAIPGESLGHYLGRFRRANCLSQSGLAELVLIDVQLLRGLEKPSFGQLLSANQLKRLCSFLGLTETQFLEMMPPV
jgi:transcriptional regulator with XRE-family HTH domain